MSQHHEQQQERRRLKNQTKALYQAQRRANPVVRSLERSSDTGRRRIAREEPGVQEQQQKQEQLGKDEEICTGLLHSPIFIIFHVCFVSKNSCFIFNYLNSLLLNVCLL